MNINVVTLLVLTIVMLIGCEDNPKDNVERKIATDRRLTVMELSSTINEKWTLIEIEYNGRKYVLLRNYDTNNQSMVKIDDFPIDK